MTRRRWWLYLGLCALGIGAAYAPTIASGFGQMQAERSDTVFFNYILEHQWRAITGTATGAFWSPAFFYPAPQGLAYSESMVGTLPIYAALRLALAPTTAYQVWAMVLLALDFLAMLWLLRRLEVRPLIAATGAYLFAFGLARVGHLYQQHLFPHFWAPLVFAAVIGIMQRPNWRDWITLGGALAGQMISSLHLGWFLAFGTAVWMAVWLLIDADARRRVLGWTVARGRIAGLMVIGAASAGLVLLVIGPYLAGFRAHGSRDDGQVAIFGPRWQSWLSAPRQSILGGLQPALDADAAPFAYEHELFPGVVPIGLGAAALITLFRRRRSSPRAAISVASTTAAIALVALSLWIPRAGPPATARARGLSLWWSVIDVVPGARGMRAHNRIWTAVHPLLLVGGLVGLEESLRRRGRAGASGIALAALAAVAIGEQIVWRQPNFDKRVMFAEVERMRAAIPAGCRVVYFTLPPSERKEPHSVGQVRAMWAAMDAGVATVNGYSSYYPPGLPGITRTASRDEVGRWLVTPYVAEPFCYVDRW